MPGMMKLKKVIFIHVVFSLIVVLPSSYAVADADPATQAKIENIVAAKTQKQITTLLRARDAGRNNLLALLGFILSVSVAVGYATYRQVRTKLESETRDKILENESRNMIRLGLRDYENFVENRHLDGVAHGALLSAVTHTRQAWFMAENMSGPLSVIPKCDMLALAGANLGYYYFELVTCVKTVDNKLAEKYRAKALQCIENASMCIDSCARRKELTNCKWWEVVESKLRVLYECSQPSLTEFAWEMEKENIAKKIKSLVQDLSIPANVRSEMSKEWEGLLKTLSEEED